MSGSDHHHGEPGGADTASGDDQPAGWRDGPDAPDGIVLYALGTYGFAFLFVPALVNAFIQDGAGRWLVVSGAMALLVGWGVALVALVQFRRWGWVGSLLFHGLALVVSLLAGDVLPVVVLLLAGFYLLSKGSLYTDDGQSGPGTA